jgi:hypothetical protein
LLVAVVLVIASLLLLACGGTSATSTKSEPAEVEQIEGSDLSRVILSATAAERLDVQTAPVRDENVVRKRTYGGEVVPAPAGEVADGSSVWVRVVLSESEVDEVDQGQPAVVFHVGNQDDGGESAFTAYAVEIQAGDEPSGASAELYYVVAGAETGLAPGQRALVEITLFGGPRKIVPYSAVIYDLHGDTWTYTNPEPLVFVRHSITIDYIEGDTAVLLDGPPAGITVVTVGAAELFGVELGVGQ